MLRRNQIRVVGKPSYAPLKPIIPLHPGAPPFREVEDSEKMTELRRRLRWAATVRVLVALADDRMPDGVIGYVIRSAGMDVATTLISRIALEPYDYEALYHTATSELAIEPFPDTSYVVTLTGEPLARTLTTIGEGREPRPMWRERGERHDPRTIALRDAWQRARIYRSFEGARRCEVLGHVARLRPWRRVRTPIVVFG